MAQPPLAGREALPHRGDFLEQSVSVWTKDKSLVDQKIYGLSPKHWCIRNKIYDLAPFIKKHPGGAIWLEETQGSDITDFVETHHFDQKKIDEILKNYFVADCQKPPSFNRYEWSDKGLFSTIRRRVAEKYKGKSISAEFRTKIQYLILISIFLCSFAFLYIKQSVVMAIITGFLMLSVLGIGHNYIHQKPSWFRYCSDLTLFGSYEWTISHALSHHSYTNLELDIEIQAFEPIIYYLSNKPKNLLINIILGQLLLALAGPLNYLRRAIFALFGKEKILIENIIPVIEFLILLSNAESFLSAFKLWLIMHSVSSLHLTLATFPNHRTHTHWSEGDPEPIKDYAKHTIISSSDHSTCLPLFLAFIFFGGFNDHILHHFFPTLDRSRIPEVKSFLVEECAKEGIKYKEANYFSNLKGVYVALFRDKPYCSKEKKN